jgi:hypothetical protein
MTVYDSVSSYLIISHNFIEIVRNRPLASNSQDLLLRHTALYFFLDYVGRVFRNPSSLHDLRGMIEK